MKPKTLFFLLFSLIPLLFNRSGLVSSQGPPPQPQELPQGIFVARIYLEDPQDIQLLSAYDVFEFRQQAEGYVLAALDAAGFLR
ncbi:MAG: hypothetical protein R6V73_08470, partial [Anaerolineales bacterium]